ncbi:MULTISPECIES: lasso RiPP family leader peptide-containing protein [Jiangella]|uniref:Lasso RiPP family leader peptide-containing protein n=2 Tax=Jiangella TaxID=281472 RepID=A0A418KNG5_9ACTN|nr:MULTISPECIES: lasso RiPP family leader peptide-containing protein [Jiangella]RIQ20479.1 lasso RiPP family leader peptide-containing protein [Jiangella rhizosphaerae]SEF17114.1 hypothetical protein SAMN04488561_5707 [Jiangella alba]
MAYEAPTLEEIGSVRELTLAASGRGRSDQVQWFRYDNDPGGVLS